MKIDDDDVREWFPTVLRSQTRDAQQEVVAQRVELQRQQSLVVNQEDRLLDLRLRPVRPLHQLGQQIASGGGVDRRGGLPAML